MTTGLYGCLSDFIVELTLYYMKNNREAALYVGEIFHELREQRECGIAERHVC
jgi:hypothetical protein